MKVAIVTGAGSGIGRAGALRLAGMGYAVVLVGRTASKLEMVAEEVRRAGGGEGKALVAVADVSRAEEVESMVHRVMGAFRRIDVLVNCAGMAPSVKLAEMAVEQWHGVMDTNASATFYAMRAVWPVMKRQHEQRGNGGQGEGGKDRGEGRVSGGVIVNISSRASRDPFAGLGAYAAAKAAVNMLTLVAAREGHEVGIRVVGIAPGATETEMFRKLPGAEKVGRDVVMRPEDVAGVIGEVVEGTMRYASGETVFLHFGPA